MKTVKNLILLALSLLFLNCTHSQEKDVIFDYPDVINIKSTPADKKDLSSFCQFDKGSWLGYALPQNQEVGKVVGPFSSIHSEWISNSILNLFLLNDNKQIIKPTEYKNVKINSFPGLLKQSFEIDSVKIQMNQYFVSSQTAIIQFTFQNSGNKAEKLQIGFEGSLNEDYQFNLKKNQLSFRFNKVELDHLVNIRTSAEGKFDINSDHNKYLFHLNNKLSLDKNKNVTITFAVSISSSDEENSKEQKLVKQVFSNPQKYEKETIKRWNKYISDIFSSDSKWLQNPEYKTIAIKSLMTLVNNWKAPLGILKHDGLFPAYSTGYFNGFWAWDSWKHSVALVHFEPELAKNQIRTMFDFQNEAGMIVDCINTDETKNFESWNLNWLNTKPPLAVWAVWEVYKKTNDKNFLTEMYSRLVKYHEWWYKNRDHDKNGLCEYGSSLPKVYACKWESGMDDGVRFDNSKMLKNNEHANSLDQESMDLNSFLVYEKELLSKISDVISKPEETKKYLEESKTLKKKVQDLMFDKNTGYFYDINIDDKSHIVVQGSEGWIPLWTKVATKSQADAAIKNILNPDKFATYIPLPTMAKDHPKFFSKGNYWRGPVWLDQVYFGIKSLKNYGYNTEADTFTKQIFERLEGLKNNGPAIRENYNPLNGKGKFGHNFSWSAAHLLLLLMDK